VPGGRPLRCRGFARTIARPAAAAVISRSTFVEHAQFAGQQPDRKE
jgi:hypothetical protein